MLADSMTIPEIAEALQTARFEEVLVTVPEGMRAKRLPRGWPKITSSTANAS